MKISCEVIKDLLPLYYDDICSDESKKLVEEHLLDCEECNTYLKNISESLEIGYDKFEEEALDLKGLSRAWNKKLLWSMLKGAIYMLIAVIIILGIVSIFVGIKVG